MHQKTIDFHMLTIDLLLFPMEYAERSSQKGEEIYDEVTSSGIPSGKTLTAIFNPLREYMRSQDSVVSASWRKKYHAYGNELQVFHRLQLTLNCPPESEDAGAVKELVNRKAEEQLVMVLDHLGKVSGSSLPAHLFLLPEETPFDAMPNEVPYQQRESAEIARNFLLDGKIAAGKHFIVGNREFVFPRVLSVDSSRHPFGNQESLKFRVSSVREKYERLVKADTDIRLNNNTGIPVVFSEASIVDARARGLIASEADLQGRRVHALVRRCWPSVFIQGDPHVGYHIDKLVEFLD